MNILYTVSDLQFFVGWVVNSLIKDVASVQFSYTQNQIEVRHFLIHLKVGWFDTQPNLLLNNSFKILIDWRK